MNVTYARQQSLVLWIFHIYVHTKSRYWLNVTILLSVKYFNFVTSCFKYHIHNILFLIAFDKQSHLHFYNCCCCVIHVCAMCVYMYTIQQTSSAAVKVLYIKWTHILYSRPVSLYYNSYFTANHGGYDALPAAQLNDLHV